MGYVIYLSSTPFIRYHIPYIKTVGKKRKCNPCEVNERSLVKVITTPIVGN